MRILMNTGGIASTNCYVVVDDESKHAILFDAPNDTTEVLLDEAESRGLDIVGLYLTHGHFDHIADHEVVTRRFHRARVLIHPLDEPKLISPVSQLFPLPFVIPPRKADGYFSDGQELTLGALKFRVMHTPGHSPGHVAFYFHEDDLLVGGDLIIGGSVGRTDLPDSDPDALVESLRRVMALPDATRLLPGHGRPTLLKEERANNEFVRMALGLE
jgi:glyoxylase-like metal-dependent hydrolase (beta-lactamase superfamily II)